MTGCQSWPEKMDSLFCTYFLLFVYCSSEYHSLCCSLLMSGIWLNVLAPVLVTLIRIKILHLYILWIRVDLRLAISSKMLQWEKQMCRCDCRSYNLIDIIHSAYRFAFMLCVYANMLIFVLTLSPSPQMLCLSHILSLCLSLLVSSLSLFLWHT